jgi:hypothetical protein
MQTIRNYWNYAPIPLSSAHNNVNFRYKSLFKLAFKHANTSNITNGHATWAISAGEPAWYTSSTADWRKEMLAEDEIDDQAYLRLSDQEVHIYNCSSFHNSCRPCKHLKIESKSLRTSVAITTF